MNRVIVMLRANEHEWARMLAEALPDHHVTTQCAPLPPGGSAYVVTDKPARCRLDAFGPSLAAVFSINAGIEALLEPGIVPETVPIVRMVDDGLSACMLDWVLAATLAWHRNLFVYRDLQSRGVWSPQPEKTARERTVCVLGAGALGAPVAEMLARIGFVVRSWSRTPKTITGVACMHGDAGLASCVRGADILVNLLPLTERTENLLDAPLLGLLARGGVLVNAGRGRHLVDEAVLSSLDTGQLSAAFLDVFREEPLPPTHPFWHHPAIHLSPHVAAPTHPGSAVAAIARNILQFEAGGALRHGVDRTRSY